MPGLSDNFNSVPRLSIIIIGAYSLYLSLLCSPCNIIVINYVNSGFRFLNFNYLFHRTVCVPLFSYCGYMGFLSGFSVSAPLVTQSLRLEILINVIGIISLFC